MNKNKIKKGILKSVTYTEKELNENFSFFDPIKDAWNSEISGFTELYIDDIESGTEYYYQVSYGSKKLGKMIIMNCDFYIGSNLDDFIDNMLWELKQAEKLETKITLK